MASPKMIQSGPVSKTLAERLRERIKRQGPITFRDWMQAALYDEQEGYYRRKDRRPWGREGDYRTSPERSTLFAATFTGYFAKLYRELGSPAGWTILEAGAGDGRFAAGILETLHNRFPEIFSATTYVIDEVGGWLTNLEAFADRVQFKSLADIDPINPGIIFSNELLDAFPVHRITVANGGLCELYITVAVDDGLEWITGPLSDPALDGYLKASAIELGEGQIADVNLEIEEWLRLAANRLASGYLVTVDYGAEAAELFSPAHRHGTLRGFHRHQLVADVLASPGEQDLTSTIDWTFVKRAGRRLGLETVKLGRQDKFLLQAGLLEELELQMQQTTGEAQRLRLSTSAREMILPDGMAASFQVLVQRKTRQ